MITEAPVAPRLPALAELGQDLLHITPLQRWTTLALPFVCVAAYVALAALHLWPLAVLALMYLSFVTYGSISHDLVHSNLGLSRPVNEFFLAAVEILAFRSGHAYRMVHLHHHSRFPHDDDIEGAAAKMSLPRAVLEGVVFIPRVTLHALRRPHSTRRLVIAEVVIIVSLLILCFAVTPITPIFAVYAVLMIAGSWLFPLATSYLPHDPAGESALFQTRLFRGRVASIIAMEHLYHLEHHLYPAVPHHNWPKLARRLDPYFADAGLKPVVLWF